MKWFEGSINEAVATSKSRRAIFVVFVEGKDDTSTQFARAIDTAEVSSRLEQEHFVAIRLESGSETYRFFAQIYQLVPVPSLFFIGENGTPLEIVADNTTESELLVKIDSVLVKAGKAHKNASMQLIDAEQKATAAGHSSDVTVSGTATKRENSPKAESESVVTNTVESTLVSDKEALQSNATEEPISKTVDAPATNIEEPVTKKTEETENNETSREPTTEEKLERARLLIEAQKKQRAEEEQKKEKERELERRRLSRDVQKARQRQQDLEMKQAHDERVKERAADAAAREKVRQQIAQDKLERKQKELAFQQQMQQKQQQSQEQQKPYVAPAVSDATVTRIQFRLPSGNPHMGQFESTSTLGALRSYVIQNIDLPFRQFSMSTSFPRRDLTHEDDQKTLLELELVPTAVILILPLKNANPTTTVTPAQEGSFLSRFIWSLFMPVIGVYNYIMSYFTRGTRRNTQQWDNSDEEGETVNSSEAVAASSVRQTPNNPGLVRRYLSSQGGTSIRAEGNIHRLHSGGDDNDENNTWNGNSTQQM